jgi:hypothetical protein
MTEILNNISRLNGAAIAFSKSGRIIGWSCIGHSNYSEHSTINTFVSKRYRHNGIAKNLIRNIVKNNKHRKCSVFDWPKYMFLPIDQVLDL